MRSGRPFRVGRVIGLAEVELSRGQDCQSRRCESCTQRGPQQALSLASEVADLAPNCRTSPEPKVPCEALPGPPPSPHAAKRPMYL